MGKSANRELWFNTRVPRRPCHELAAVRLVFGRAIDLVGTDTAYGRIGCVLCARYGGAAGFLLIPITDRAQMQTG